MNELIVVIPAYEPDYLMIELINKLNNYFTDFKMIVVNDGSKGKDDLFSEAKSLDNVILLEHEVNRGKGAALKTAFKYIKEIGGNHVIVTADSDGQHKPEDIYRVYQFYKKFNKGLVLGSRKFDCEIPARSRFGNDVARLLLQLCNRQHLNDTQTGLRAFGSDLLDFMLEIKGNRYEYEMDMLALCARGNIEINEIAIETIYINNNSGSHFRPVRDFTRICSVVLKYSWTLIITLLIEALLFAGYYLGYKNSALNPGADLIAATLTSSIVALIFNMLLNHYGLILGNNKTFKFKNRVLRYFVNAAIVIALNVLLIFGLNLLFSNIVAAKIVTDILIIIAIPTLNYFISGKNPLSEE